MDSSSPFAKIVAGGIAGMSETFITYPAEFAKTRLQLHNSASSAPQTKRPTSFAILRSTISGSGLRGVYAGCAALATSNAAKSGIRFFSFESTRARLDAVAGTRSEVPRPAWVNIISGLSAGVVESLLVVTPGEAIKTRMVHAAGNSMMTGASRPASSGVLGVVGNVVRHEGVSSLWRGVLPVLCKQGTNSAVRFTTFAMLQERLALWWPSLSGHVGSTLLLGGISGVITVYASMPFDNIKTKMQAGDVQYRGMLECARKTLAADGIRAFWRGTSPRLVRLTLSSGVTFTVYDQVIRAFSWLKMDAQSQEVRDLA